MGPQANPLGDYLRARRVQVRPEEVGLTAGVRRRVPGLRASSHIDRLVRQGPWRLARSGRVGPQPCVSGPAERADERVEPRLSMHCGTSGRDDVPFDSLPWSRKRYAWW